MIFGLVRGVFRERSVAVMGFDGISRSGRSISFEMVLLPLDAGRDSPRCLGLTTACERAFWLGSDPVIDSHVQSVRVVDPDRDPLFLKNRPAVAVAGTTSDTTKTKPFGANIPRRVRHLVVLDGGRAE
jgi:hypothetical protein